MNIKTVLISLVFITTVNAEPSSEAIGSCLGKAINDSCYMYIDGKDKKGKCVSLPNKEYLACSLKEINLNEKSTNGTLFTPIQKGRIYVD